MHAAGNGHRSGEEWRSASEKGVLSRLPDKRGNWRSVGCPGLHQREDDKVVRAARRREQGRKRQAIPAGLTGSGGRTRRSQVRVPMHHGPGLSEDQCQREQHAEPRGIPLLGQGPGLCHPHSIAWMTGRSRIHRRRTREPGIGSAVADIIGKYAPLLSALRPKRGTESGRRSTDRPDAGDRCASDGGAPQEALPKSGEMISLEPT